MSAVLSKPKSDFVLPLIEEKRCPLCGGWSGLVSITSKGKKYHCEQCGVWRLKNRAAVELGHKGGIARANVLTSERRKEIGRIARKARFEKEALTKETIDIFSVEKRRSLMAFSQTARGKHTLQEWLALVQYCEEKCVACGNTGIRLTKDHIISRKLGGSDRIDNLQPLCQSCNSIKGTKAIDFRPFGWWVSLKSVMY